MCAVRSTAFLLLSVVILTNFTKYSVHAKFRGAQPKKIPSLGADGGVVDPNAGVAVAVRRKDSNVRKGVRRTKGGLLPWWVRKRLQEQTKTQQESEDKTLYKPSRKKEKTLHKNVQIVQLARDDREDAGTGDTVGLMQSGDSAIVVKDLPLEDEFDEAADDRLATLDTQMGILAENARMEELSRGSGAEPDLLMDEAVKRAVEEHESAAAKSTAQQQAQSAAAAGSQADLRAADQEDAGEDSEIEAGQEQGSLDYEDGKDADSRRRTLLQKGKKKKRRKGKNVRNPEDMPGSVSRSLPYEVLPAEREEMAAAGLQWPEVLQQEGVDEEDDRGIVMTDVSKTERQAEQQSAVSDPGDSDNFEEGLLSAVAEEGESGVVHSRETSEVDQGRGRGAKRRRPARRRKGRGEGPRRAAGGQARKRGGAKNVGEAGGEPRRRGKKGKGKGRKSKGQGRRAF